MTKLTIDQIDQTDQTDNQGGILFWLRGSGVTLEENFARNSVIFDIYLNHAAMPATTLKTRTFDWSRPNQSEASFK